MKVQELRIGNWIKDGNEFEQIEIDHLICLSSGRCEFDPIPLTEEWLKKLGLTEGFGLNIFHIEITENCMMSVDLQGNLDIGDEVHLYEEIWYVHQLQNLYFALTGEELTLKTK